MNMSSHTRYTYLRNNDRSPHSCVAVRLNRNNNIILYQVASLNKNEDSFIKIRARFIACQRLNKKPFEIRSNLFGLSAHDITKLIMTDIVSRNNHSVFDSDNNETFIKGLPQQARNAAKKWLNKHQTFTAPALEVPVAPNLVKTYNINYNINDDNSTTEVAKRFGYSSLSINF